MINKKKYKFIKFQKLRSYIHDFHKIQFVAMFKL